MPRSPRWSGTPPWPFAGATRTASPSSSMPVSRPDGDLATTLRWSVRIGLPLKYRMFELMVAPQARKAAALDVEALKRRLESVAGQPT